MRTVRAEAFLVLVFACGALAAAIAYVRRTQTVRADAFLLAFASGALTAAIAYVALRLAERALFPSPNPVLVVSSFRSGLVWRLALSLYLGGMGAFAGFAWASRSRVGLTRWIARGVAFVAALAIVQGILAP
jgi:hypothetical protein